MIQWATAKSVKAADTEGVTSDTPSDQLSYWIDRAMRAILYAVPDLVQRVDDQRVAPEAPADVQVDLVLAKIANPRGIRSVQETNGPTSGSVTFGGDSPGALSLSADQLRILGGRASRSRTARTVTTW